MIKIFHIRFFGFSTETFSESTTVKNEGLIDALDRTIWDFAKEKNYVILTQDSDFNNLTSLFGHPPKIIWIRTGNLRTYEIADILIKYYDELEKFIADEDHGCFEILNLSQ